MRIGIDVGGSKIAGVALARGGRELGRARLAMPRDIAATVEALVAMARDFEERHGAAEALGLCVPGMIAADGRILRAVNLPWLEGRPLVEALGAALEVPVAIANDANCFALSEAVDGAAAGAAVVFGAVLGTGVGGGIVVGGRTLAGANAVAGEWGHNPLPWASAADGAAVRCGCGRLGCIESWLNGAALARDHAALAGRALEAGEVAARAEAGDDAASAAVGRYADRLARALAGLINVLDPDVVVLGGGLSAIGALYVQVPALWGRYGIADAPRTRLVRARHGPDSGMRGAAWL